MKSDIDYLLERLDSMDTNLKALSELLSGLASAIQSLAPASLFQAAMKGAEAGASIHTRGASEAAKAAVGEVRIFRTEAESRILGLSRRSGRLRRGLRVVALALVVLVSALVGSVFSRYLPPAFLGAVLTTPSGCVAGGGQWVKDTAGVDAGCVLRVKR